MNEFAEPSSMVECVFGCIFLMRPFAEPFSMIKFVFGQIFRTSPRSGSISMVKWNIRPLVLNATKSVWHSLFTYIYAPPWLNAFKTFPQMYGKCTQLCLHPQDVQTFPQGYHQADRPNRCKICLIFTFYTCLCYSLMKRLQILSANE